MIKWDLSQRYKDFSIPANQSMWYIDININNINKFKNQNHVIIPIVAEKSSDKIQHTVMIKKYPESGHRGTVPQYNKSHI